MGNLVEPTRLGVERAAPSSGRVGEVLVEGAGASAGVVVAAWAVVLARHAGVTAVRFAVARDGVRGELVVALDEAATGAAWIAEVEAALARLVLGGGDAPTGVALDDDAWTPSGDTSVVVAWSARGLVLRHDEARIDVATACALAAQLATVITQLGAGAGRVGALTLLDAAAERVIARKNRTARPVPPESVHAQVAAAARRTPERIAIWAGETSVTFAELHARARRLATWLRARGVGPEARVGVALDRSPELVVALLGILEAGAAYVPLDPGYPAARLATMVEDAGARVVVTSAARRAWAGETFGAVELVVEADVDGAGEGGDVAVDELAAAYVIYTSGSTGKPKGVVVTHRNVSSFMVGMDERIGLGGGVAGVLLALTSVSFDISVLELFWSLARGFTVVVMPEEPLATIGDPHAGLPAQLARHRVTHLQCTPSLARALLEEPAAVHALRGLTFMLVGGEALPADLAARLADTVGTLVNMYGPTETTIWSSTKEIARRAPRVTLGAPIANTSMHVVDGAGREAAIGVAGELLIGGAGLARGYLGRPELTAERFVPDPFAATPGGRLYRTGDLVRRLPDGELEFLARVDLQVKIRGHRIEIGEIEARLGQHPAVRECAVIARDDGPGGEKRLVGYLAARGAPPDEDEVRTFLARELPTFMVPAELVVLPALPLTPNKKIDRKALPAPPVRARVDAADAPRSAGEAEVAAAFAEVLGVGAVGRDDDFFALGGSSVSAIVLASAARRRGLAVTPAVVFRARTPAAIAAASGGTPVEVAIGASGDDAFATTPTQAGMLFHTFEAPASRLFASEAAFELRGVIDDDTLRAAWRDLVARHEMLRVAFEWSGRAPRQRIAPTIENALELRDLRGLDPAAQTRAIDAHRAIERERAIELDHPPLTRAIAFRLADDRVELGWRTHHAALDGWSSVVLARDLVALVRARREGARPPVAPPPFRAFVDWLATRPAEADEAYWRPYLAGLEPTPAPARRPRAVDAAPRLALAGRTLPAATRDALAVTARRLGCASSAVLEAAWAIHYAHVIGVDEVVYGDVSSGRAAAAIPGVEALAGCCICTVPRRVRVEPTTPLATFTRAIEADVIARWAVEHVALTRLHEWAGLPPGRPLFETVFAVQSAPALPDGGGLAVRQVWSFDTVDNPLTIEVDPDRGSLRALYDERAIAPDDVARLIDGLERTIAAITAAADGARVGDLVLIAPDERRRVVEVFNATADASAHEGPFAHEQLTRWARERPDAIALEDPTGTLAFGELEARANALAHHLIARGVGRDDVVALLGNRSIEAVVAIFAILKAGAAYLPIDDESPALRVRELLSDGVVRVAITADDEQAAKLAPCGLAHVVRLDRDRDELARGSTAPPRIAIDPRQLAYVMHTSGSTGRPKGAMVAHGSIRNLLAWCQREHPLGADDAMLFKAPFGFDSGVFELFWPIAIGARMIILPRGAHRDARATGDTIRDRGADATFFVPSMLSVFLDEEPSACAAMRLVIVGGEALTPELVRRFRAVSDATLLNIYGPTETCVFVTTWVGDPAEAVVPIGRPITNLQAYVLDAWLRPVPPGVVGDLYLGGAGLGRGYLARPDLTAATWVPDPFGDGARLYRTGDLARWRSDGQLDFFGRRDHQVKLRGLRVELGEIEATLQAHPGVQEVAVLARKDDTGRARLVAYVLGRGVAVEALREHAARLLPEHMVPQVYVAVDTFPRTTSGKIDRRALPDPPRADVGTATPARTALEARLIEVWREVLGVPEVGIDDDFFALGGDSILTIQLVGKLRRIGVEVRPRDVFVSRTIAGLAALAGAAAPAAGAGVVAPPRAPATPIQRWFLEANVPDAHQFNQAVWLTAAPGVDADTLARALAAVVAHHRILTARFVRDADGWWCEPGVGPAPVLERSDATAVADVAALVERLQRSLAPARGEVFRAAWLPDGRLLLVAHHLVIDAISWRVLRADLARASRDPRALEAATPWTVWADALARAAPAAVSWPATAPIARLPVDRPDAPDEVGATEHVSISLSVDETDRLTRADARPHELLLAALWVALARWTGSPSISVALEAHGRGELPGHAIDVSRTIGWFTSVFPIALVGSPATLRERVELVRAAVAAIPEDGQALSFGLAARGRAIPFAGIGTGQEVVLNYLGSLDGDARDAAFVGPIVWEPRDAVGARQPRPFALEVEAAIVGGALTIDLHHARDRHAPGTIAQVGADVAATLRALLAAPGDTIEATSPLTPFQEGLLADTLRSGRSDAYVVQVELVIEGGVDPMSLREAWRRAIARHDVLRTAITWRTTARPAQVVMRDVDAPVVVDDLRGADPSSWTAAIAARVAEDRAAGFDLERAPLFRVRLVVLRDDLTHMVWTCHHLVIDGWSIPIVVDELFRPPAAPPTVRFRDVVRRIAARDDGADQAFWRERLRDADATATLPFGALDVPAGLAPHDAFTHALAPGLVDRLAAWARRHGVTFGTIVHGAWALLVARYADADDVIVGAVGSGRSTLDLEGADGVVGCLIGTLPLRTRPTDARTVVEWLGELQGELWELQRAEHTPLTTLQRIAALPAGRPLFETFVAFENYPSLARVSAGATGPRVRCVAFHERPLATLALAFDPYVEAQAEIAYDRRRLSDAAARRVGRHLEALLAGIADATAATRVGALELVTADDVVEHAPHLSPALAAPARLETLVWAHARRQPDALAVVAHDRRVTYGELAAAAAKVAARLRARGVVPGAVVAITSPRGAVETIVGLLGALDVGAAFLWVDPTLPEARRALLLEDAGVAAVLDAAELRAAEVAPAPGPPAALALSADAPAYVIYTSGTTGRPKGVIVPHASISRVVAAHARGMDLGPDARVSQFFSLGFDAALLEIFGALTSGAALHLLTKDEALPSAELGAWLDAHAITAFTITGSALAALPYRALPTLRAILVGGDPCPDAVLARWGDGRRLLVGYGPAEATIQATWALDPRRAGVIGGPMPGRVVRVLDRGLRPVASGLPGELYLGGPLLAYGYVGRPDLTAERFVPDPFAETPGARVYRTGDFARRTPGGELEFRGRQDGQVKVRGYRVELAEIELALGAIAGVREALVVARDAPSGKRLVGYVVGDVPVDEVRARLADRLPEHMIPSAFVRLDGLPLTAHGKVDVRALPDPEVDARDHVAPRTPLEAQLAAIWAGVLGVPRVGVEDHFFAIGGDSIQALLVVGACQQAGLPVRAAQLFRHPTVAALAARLERAGEVAPTTAPAGPVPLTPIQRWFLDGVASDAHHFNLPVELEIADGLDAPAVELIARAVVARHDAFRLRFTRDDAAWTQTLGDDVGFAWEATPAGALDAAVARAQRTLDLARGPLARAVFDGRRLVLVIHHLIVDLVSLRVLAAELDAAASAVRAGSAITLGPPPTSFARWARGVADAHVDDDVLAAWRAALAPAAAIGVRASMDPPRPRELTVGLPAAATHTLTSSAVATTAELLVAALARALRATGGGGETFVIGLEGHGRVARDDLDVARTVGWFTSFYPLRVDAPADVARTIAGVRAELAAIPDGGQGTSFGRLEATGAVTRFTPALTFNYHGRTGGPTRDAAIRIRSFDVPGAWSPAHRQRHLVEVNVAETEAGLTASFQWDAAVDADVRALATAFEAGVAEVVAHLDADTRTEAVLPLAPGQASIFVASLATDDRAAYQTQVTIAIEGAVDAPRLERAWADVLARHQALRARFVGAGLRAPRQVIERAVALPLVVHDLRATPERADGVLDAERERPLDLDDAPLMRIALLRTRDDRAVLSWVCHHLVVDGWSAQLVIADVRARYEALGRGAATPLPPAPSLVDALATRARDDDARRAFWRPRLAREARGELPWPSAGGGGGFGWRTSALSADASAAVFALARRLELTPAAILHAAWARLLAAYTGAPEVVFGTISAGRARLPAAAAAGLVGCLVNTLPFHAAPPATRSVRSWLADVARDLRDVLDHEDVALPTLRRWGGARADVDRLETMLAVENYPERATDGGSWAEPVVVERSTFPLALLVEVRTAITLSLSFDRARVDDAMADHILAHTRELLRGFAADPDLPVGAIPLLDREERARVLDAWNVEPADAPIFRPFHGLIEDVARVHAARRAVVGATRTLTYAELDREANRLAHHLGGVGVGRERVVAIASEDNVTRVIATLAIGKAGGAFLPLSLSHPDDRLAWQLADVGAAALIVDRAARARFVAPPCPVVDLDADAAAIARAPADAPAVRVEPHDAAYVIYTSGSTGTPKGVLVEHHGIPHLARAIREVTRLAPGDVLLQFAAPAFDASIFEIATALFAGATLVGGGEADVAPGPALRAFLARHACTHALLTPSTLALTPSHDLPTLRHVFSAGEALPPAVAARWRDGRTLDDLYGPAEATIFATWQRVGADTPPSIGRPIPSTTVRVYDAALTPVAIGVVGELAIGGPTLARGYVGRPDLTAARFVPDPHARTPGARVYLTGDLARRRPTGELVYVGRVDGQVKIRGQRVELGEVEASLAAAPGVLEAAVIFAPETHELIAYVVPATAGAALDPHTLRDALRRRLPEAWVPRRWVVLPALPRSPNLKLDRRALPAPPDAPADVSAPRLPTGDVEGALVAIFGQVLGRATIGVDDDFFELGGDSIAALQIVALASERGLAFSTRDLFTATTIARLAPRVGIAPAAGAALDPLGPVPLAPIQRWFLDADPADAYHFNQAIWLTPQDPRAGVERALATVAAAHPALRLRFTRHEGGWHQTLVDAATVRFTRVDLSAMPGADRDAAVARLVAETQRGIDLALGPLLHALWVDRGDAPARLLLVAHHLVVDLVSWTVLLGDLERVLAQLRAGAPPALPAGGSFVQVARALADAATRPAVAAHRAAWTATLAGVPALPVDGPGEDTYAAEHEVVRRATTATTDALRELARTRRASVTEVVLAALGRALARWTGATSFLVDVEGHGRVHAPGLDIELERPRLVGWMTSLAPVRLDVAADTPLDAALAAVRAGGAEDPEHRLAFALLGLRSPAAIVVNYLGETGGGAAPFELEARDNVSPRAPRRHALSIAARLHDGVLELAVAYARGRHHEATITALVEQTLVGVAELVATIAGTRHAPSDFPSAGLDDDDLAAVLRETE